MRRSTKLLSCKEIKFRENLYPRADWSWKVAYGYSVAMRQGSKFPLITVARLGKDYVLIDGKHRLEAYKIAKIKHIQCEVLSGVDENRIYVEAVKKNITHGKQFSVYDKAQICVRLKDIGYDIGEISRIVLITKDKIMPFVAKRVINTLSDGEVVIKAPLRRFAEEYEMKPIRNFNEDDQRYLSGRRPEYVLDEIITLIKNGWIDMNNGRVTSRLAELYELLSGIIIAK